MNKIELKAGIEGVKSIIYCLVESGLGQQASWAAA